MTPLGGSVQVSPIRRVLATPQLRRLELAFAGFSSSEHATWLAVLVYALDRGGPREVGIAAVVQLLPAVVLTPFSSFAGDRFAPRLALAAGYATQCVAMACTAAAMWADAPVAVYVSATVVAVSVSFVRPVMGSVLPRVTHRPSDLVAANVVSGLVEQFGVFVGPLTAGVLIAVGSPATVFATASVLLGAGAVAVSFVRSDDELTTARPDASDAVRAVFAGFVALRARRLRLFVVLVAIAGVVKGVGDLAFVTLADLRLEGGGGLSGVLSGAYGLGGITGALAVGMVARRRGTGTALLAAATCIAGGITLASFADRLVPAMLGLAATGAGEAALMITAVLSIQREAHTDVLARLFGVVEGAMMGSIALGSLASSSLTTHLSLGGVLLVAGAAVAGAVAVVAWRLRRAGGEPPRVDEAVVERLLQDPVLAPLSAPTIERLARAVDVVRAGTEDEIVRQGDRGDHYFLVVDGTVRVLVDQAHVRFLTTGQSFGEIALLRGVPRTASVVAVTPCTLLAMERDHFLAAVTGHARAFSTAHDAADRYLSDDRESNERRRGATDADA